MLNLIRFLLIGFSMLIVSLAQALSLQVTITGVNEELKKNILADLHLQQAVTEPKVTVRRINNLYDIAEKQIIETLQANGYYNSTIQQNLTKNLEPNQANEHWIATFDIAPGKPTLISSVSLITEGPGKSDIRAQNILTTPELIVGKVLLHADYEGTKEKILSDLNAIGYLQAEFIESSILVNRSTLTASIKFRIKTGVLYKFGKITFIDCVYPDTLLVRYLPFSSGDPYNLNQLMDFQNNLEKADLFSKIRFDPITNFNDPNDNIVPINVRLNTKPKNRYTGSVGYGTDSGPRASAGWQHRRTATPGHKIAALISTSKILKAAKLNYTIPGEHAATDSYIYGINIQEAIQDNRYSRKAETSFNNSFQGNNTETIYGASLFTETSRLTNHSNKYSKSYLLPNAKWIWSNTDTKNDFDYGSKIYVFIRAGIKSFMSATNLLQLELGGKKIIPLWDNSRLILRTDLGSVQSKHFSNLPISLRFFTGGDESVRGFAYNSIGPREIKNDPHSDNMGGKYLAIGSAEIEKRIYRELSVAAFSDFGTAAMSLKEAFGKSLGVGIRYKTPIGNFRVDLAKPLNLVSNKHWRLHISFGTDF